jgi:glutathione peroxidase
MSFHAIAVRTIDGRDTTLADFQGRAVLIVNVASQCGLTPQYAGLQALHTRLSSRGLAVLGFPCNQFGAQEPGSEAQIKQFCESRFQVDFPMFAKIEVNGPNTHPLYQWLKAQSGGADIGWNFAKFLIDGNGAFVKRFAPTDSPESIAPAIEPLLK